MFLHACIEKFSFLVFCNVMYFNILHLKNSVQMYALNITQNKHTHNFSLKSMWLQQKEEISHFSVSIFFSSYVFQEQTFISGFDVQPHKEENERKKESWLM